MTPDHAHHFFLLTLLTLGAIVFLIAMRTFADARRSRRPDQSNADMIEVKGRLASIEKILREVG